MRYATTEDLKGRYQKVYCKATDGNYYLLKDYYPIAMNVADKPNLVYLDTGGPMGPCDFFIAKIEDGKLLRQDILSREFRVVSQEVIVKE